MYLGAIDFVALIQRSARESKILDIAPLDMTLMLREKPAAVLSPLKFPLLQRGRTFAKANQQLTPVGAKTAESKFQLTRATCEEMVCWNNQAGVHGLEGEGC